MQINLQSKNIELTDEIKNYAEKRVTNLDKLLSGLASEEAQATLEVSRNTLHHKAGDVFHADCSLTLQGKHFYASSDNEDLYTAIDNVKDTLFNDINKTKGREQTLLVRGARSVKKMLKGLSDRNPFTSKY
ncbi:MAG: ribosome-associated translation inhibitor RaiA [Candidatus Paceibacterota bacterium]|jgi:ribosomal subunit interface protein